MNRDAYIRKSVIHIGILGNESAYSRLWIRSHHIADYEYAGSIHSPDRQPNCRQTAGQDQKKMCQRIGLQGSLQVP